MFSLHRLNSIRSLHKAQHFEKLLNSANDNSVRQIWVSAGHVFVSWHGGRRLTSFDTVPVQRSFVPQEGRKTDVCSESGCLDLQRQETDVIELSFKKKNPTELYITFANGQIEVWEYRTVEGSDTPSWTSRGGFRLWSGDHGRRVCSAFLHEEQNCLYWCEKRAVDVSNGNLVADSDNGVQFMYFVSKKSLPLSHETVSSHTVGSTFTFLEHCPPCQLYSTKDGVMVWPEQPCPVGLYFMWHQTKNMLQVCSLDTGCVTAHMRVMSSGIAFADAVRSSVSVWAQNSQPRNNGLVTVIKDSFQDQLLLILESGDVMSLSNKGSLQHKCHIAQWAAVFSSIVPSDCEWFMYTFVIGCVVPDGRVLLFHSETGSLVQEIQQFSEPDYEGSTFLWVGSGQLPSVGLWSTTHGMWELCMSVTDTASMRAVLNPVEHVHLMTGLSQTSSAARLTLEEAVKYYRDRTAHGENIDIESLMKNTMLQSPALLVALLHSHSRQVSDHIERDHLAQLMSFHYSSGPMTKIQETLHPLLNQFWDLETKWRSLITADGTTEQERQERAIQSEVRMLLKSEENISPTNLAQLELLALKFPTQFVRTLLHDLHVTDASETTQLKNDQMNLWPTVLSTDRTSSNMPVFELVCRLLYREQPSQLLAFVHKATHVKDDIIGPSALSRSSSLYDRAFHCLHVPESSCTNMDTVLAYCELLASTTNNDAALEALRLLLRFNRLKEAVSLVSKNADESKQHSALFHTLLVNILESDTFQCVDQSIWDLVPKTFGADQLLSLLQEHLPSRRRRKGKSMRLHVLCSSPNDTSLSVLKGVLLSTILEHDEAKEKLCEQ
ncbi:PREDICTED: uncharacterized protein LOC109474825 [Branchiostoma belcheri]|uniref:Uncharacterized protein LOC109474825 n=1 Tax=Branchiostoma belcheri TaxID=7741 RepID=A0A6P4Z2K8_BRABE|nr:PREDICTED: uncharacterized protein LOC109474825 [Branchiostoma belcheri]